ncbi:hypothetical protein TeGR_g11393, partial [Tetraparma gracilis]
PPLPPPPRRYASEGTCKLLVGNKNDRQDKRPNLSEQAKAFSDDLGIPFLETSAKSSHNVEEAFLTMAGELIKIREARGSAGGGGKVDLRAGQKGGGAGCC